MGFLIGLFTVVMVLDCLVLIFLVLLQLPKKEAGAGLAFGGAATDALFGAGSGNVLTKITKYAATTFFVMAVVLSMMQSYYHRRTATEFGNKLGQAGPPPAMPATAPEATTPSSTPQRPTGKQATAPGTNGLRVLTSTVDNTNLAVPIITAPAATNAPK